MPSVTIIVPCLNEEKTIDLLLGAIYNQTFDRSAIEVIIADGLSTDRTREKIQQFSQDHPGFRVRVVDNIKRTIPAGLNCALAEAGGEYILRLDAHCVPSDTYVEICVKDLQTGKGDNVGGVWIIQPGNDTWMARAISLAAAHPLGVGDAKYRHGTDASLVDTVPFGAFKKETFTKFGVFDESLLSNEDYEFNSRLRAGGGKVWFDPQIKSVYFARTDLTGLAKQYWRYGYWKWLMLRSYPSTLRWRQALPPALVLSIIVLGFLAPFSELIRILFGFEVCGYLFALWVGTGLTTRPRVSLKLWIGMNLAIMTMHIFWGTGFIWSILKNRIKAVK